MERSKYGSKKDFIAKHWEEINNLYRIHSLRNIVRIYNGVITRQDLKNHLPRKSELYQNRKYK
jgi:hypothetical protein